MSFRVFIGVCVFLHFNRMRQCVLAVCAAADKPCDFLKFPVFVQLFNVRDRLVGGFFFLDFVMIVRHRRKLRKVRYRNNLPRHAYVVQFFGNDLRDVSADTGVDFVKNHRVDAVKTRRDVFKSQHKP